LRLFFFIYKGSLKADTKWR